MTPLTADKAYRHQEGTRAAYVCVTRQATSCKIFGGAIFKIESILLGEVEMQFCQAKLPEILKVWQIAFARLN